MVVMDFVGRVDGETFEGGSATDNQLVLGSGQFIPGFEEQLVGVKAGEEKVITVTFPADYPAENLKGKDATFDITVKAVKVPGETKIDDEFAKSLGLEGIEQLRGLLRGQLEQETAGLTRTQMKRQLLDVLAAGHDFEVPPSMVEAEFGQIWQQLLQEAQNEEDTEAALKEIEAEKDDYRKIAERRVRQRRRAEYQQLPGRRTARLMAGVRRHADHQQPAPIGADLHIVRGQIERKSLDHTAGQVDLAERVALLDREHAMRGPAQLGGQRGRVGHRAVCGTGRSQ